MTELEAIAVVKMLKCIPFEKWRRIRYAGREYPVGFALDSPISCCVDSSESLNVEGMSTIKKSGLFGHLMQFVLAEWEEELRLKDAESELKKQSVISKVLALPDYY